VENVARSEIAVSGPPLDDETIDRLAELGQAVRYVDVVADSWSAAEGCWAHILGGAETIDTVNVHELPSSIKLVCFLGTGFETYMDVSALAARGMATCYTPYANARSTAEFAVALLAMGLRSIPTGLSQVERGQWNPPRGRSLFRSSIGIIGFGHVGQHVNQILRNGFGISPLVWNRSDRDKEIRETGAIPASLETIFERCSAISLHVNAPSADASPLVSMDLLQIARPDVVLVNTARAALIDHAALAIILRDRPNMSVLADVYPTEPVSPTKDRYGLLALGIDRFALTPHMAYSSDDSARKLGAQVIANLQEFLAGNPLPYPAEKAR